MIFEESTGHRKMGERKEEEGREDGLGDEREEVGKLRGKPVAVPRSPREVPEESTSHEAGVLGSSIRYLQFTGISSFSGQRIEFQTHRHRSTRHPVARTLKLCRSLRQEPDNNVASVNEFLISEEFFGELSLASVTDHVV